MVELDPVAVAVESALTPPLAEAAAEVDAWVRDMARCNSRGWDFTLVGPAPDYLRVRLRAVRVLTEHAYATGAPCDGQRCEQGGAAHCHRCAEVEADKLLAERDQLREGWRRACALLADAGWNGDERWETIRAEVEEPHETPDPLNLPAYAWGESVTWNKGRILVPLNRDDQTVADLVLDEDAAGTLAAMLDDAAGHKPPDCPRCFDRGYVPDWSRGLSAEHGEPGKKPCPDCAPPVQGHLELEPMPCHQPQGTWASNHGCDPCATCGRCRICDAVARGAAERTPHSEESTHDDQ